MAGHGHGRLVDARERPAHQVSVHEGEAQLVCRQDGSQRVQPADFQGTDGREFAADLFGHGSGGGSHVGGGDEPFSENIRGPEDAHMDDSGIRRQVAGGSDHHAAVRQRPAEQQFTQRDLSATAGSKQGGSGRQCADPVGGDRAQAVTHQCPR